MTKKQKKKRSDYEKALSYGWVFEANDSKRYKYFFRVIYGKESKIGKRTETIWNINTLHIEGLL